MTFFNIFKLNSQYFTGGLSCVKLANNVIKEKTRGLAPVSVSSCRLDTSIFSLCLLSLPYKDVHEPKVAI